MQHAMLQEVGLVDGEFCPVVKIFILFIGDMEFLDQTFTDII